MALFYYFLTIIDGCRGSYKINKQSHQDQVYMWQIYQYFIDVWIMSLFTYKLPVTNSLHMWQLTLRNFKHYACFDGILLFISLF